MNHFQGKETTLVILKPDAFERKLVGCIISRFENRGFSLIKAELRKVGQNTISEHYKEHKERDFFYDLCSFMTSSPIFLMVWTGKSVVSVIRKCIGDTDGALALPGTIRGDFSLHRDKNLIHASDSQESAFREISLFFPEN